MARQVGLSKETHVERSTLTTLDGSVVQSLQTGSVDMAVEDGALRARAAARALKGKKTQNINKKNPTNDAGTNAGKNDAGTKKNDGSTKPGNDGSTNAGTDDACPCKESCADFSASALDTCKECTVCPRPCRACFPGTEGHCQEAETEQCYHFSSAECKGEGVKVCQDEGWDAK